MPAESVQAYLAALPDDRRALVQAIRAAILAALPPGYEEGIQYGMIGYYVPHSLFPAGYHCDPKQPLPFAGLASQKGYVSLHLPCLYMSAERSERFALAWQATGKKLDMGKGCVRIKSLDAVPLAVIGAMVASIAVSDFVADYQRGLSARKSPAKNAK
ncbi:MAG: DUF1801 domain-containing protein [Deltaproteobacteria bacterium]|nr:DUF1801 domain-containing protein [Deltaproteobacteria bacterium]